MKLTLVHTVVTLIASHLMLSIGASPADYFYDTDRTMFRLKIWSGERYRCAGGSDPTKDNNLPFPINAGPQAPSSEGVFCSTTESRFTLQNDGKLFFRGNAVGFTTFNADNSPDLKYEALTMQASASSRFKLSDDGKNLLITTRDNQCVVVEGATLTARSCGVDPSYIIEIE